MWIIRFPEPAVLIAARILGEFSRVPGRRLGGSPRFGCGSMAWVAAVASGLLKAAPVVMNAIALDSLYLRVLMCHWFLCD
jgi:hypothetical protein